MGRSPAFWLALCAACSGGIAYRLHRFQPVEAPDTATYQDFDWSSLKAVLSHVRTCGYPAFLAVTGRITAAPQAVPAAHWLAAILASLVLYAGLVAAGYRRGVAVCSAGTAMFGNGVLRLGTLVAADSLAISLAIAATGCFLATLVERPRRRAWVGLILLTFTTYLTRPAYLFLIPLWPVLSLWHDRFLLRRDAGWWQALRRCVCYALATVLPLVAYCTLRWGVVGHWGLISFGGYNLVGVVGQFLDEETAATLTGDVRPLAEEFLRRRARSDVEPPVDFLAMERMYNLTVWQLAVPAAEATLGGDTVAVNRGLSRLSAEILWRRPVDYARWLAWNMKHGLVELVILTGNDRGVELLILGLLGLHLWSLWQGARSGRAAAWETDGTARHGPHLERHLLWWTAVGFAAAKGLLVILVEPAINRYMTAAGALLPPALAVFVAEYALVLAKAGSESGGSARGDAA